ncbi:hypothetical protein JTE88_02145 [Arcanobacterium phocisimile]|uniref:ABC3 transporter permease C-terminal domain-containing protein n=1 Tax=Arcanobacterium phocisimile TaxID=1302235 RepID=A0ABX7IHH3_9ACTO|nr:FtsX-like permease family protein [Arcanobacterium phocisimile]QRV02576.1 hypothetical protein JTE88_02145 [Arcanobacterium phocisimile]
MLAFVFEHLVSFWRIYLLPTIVTAICTMLLLLGISTLEYMQLSVPFSAKASVPEADIRVYNSALPGDSFLTALEEIDVVKTAYSPTPLWGMVMTDSASAQLNIKSVPPKAMRVEDFYIGAYPTSADEIALPVAVARQLHVAPGDEVVLSLPSVGDHGLVRRAKVKGLYAYSPLNPDFHSLFNAISGMNMRELWRTTEGLKRVGESGILLSGHRGVPLARLKEAVLRIPGTVVVNRNETYAEEFRKTQNFVTSLTILARGLLTIPILIAGITWFYSARSILRSRQKDFALLSSLGSSTAKLFSIAVLQMMGIGAAAVAVGIFFGNMLTTPILNILQGLPGSHFFLPFFQPSLQLSFISTVFMLGVLLASTAPSAWNLVYFLHQPNYRGSTTPSLLPCLTRWLASVALGTSIIIFAGIVTRGNHVTATWSSYSALFALMTIFGIVTLALLTHLYMSNWLRTTVLRLDISLSRFMRQQPKTAKKTTCTGLFSARLLVLCIAGFVVVITTHSSSAALIEHIAGQVSPYDISVRTDENSESELSDELIAMVDTYPGIKNSLVVYSASVSLSSPISKSSTVIDVRAVDRDDSIEYFADDSHADVPQSGVIRIPRDLMSVLEVENGDVITFQGVNNGAVPLTVQQSSTPWVVMELQDFQHIQHPLIHDELWLKTTEKNKHQLSSFFTRFRSAVLGTQLRGGIRIHSGITGETLTIAERPHWTTPILAFLTASSLLTALVVVLMSTPRANRFAKQNSRLRASLGISPMSLHINNIVEIVGFVLIDTIIGIGLGLLVMPPLWFYLLGLKYAESLIIPLNQILLLGGAIVLLAIGFTLIRPIFHGPKSLVLTN